MISIMYDVVKFDKSRIEDYLRIFDQASSGSVVCYCTHWNMTQEEIDNKIMEPVKNNVAPLSQISCEVAVERINKKLYGSIRCMGEYEYSSPLVAKVTFLSANFPSVPSTFWKGWKEVLPEEFKECIKADPNYAECFE